MGGLEAGERRLCRRQLSDDPRTRMSAFFVPVAKSCLSGTGHLQSSCVLTGALADGWASAKNLPFSLLIENDRKVPRPSGCCRPNNDVR